MLFTWQNTVRDDWPFVQVADGGRWQKLYADTKKSMHIKIKLNMQIAEGMTLSQESASPVFFACVDLWNKSKAWNVNKKLGRDLRVWFWPPTRTDAHTGRQQTKNLQIVISCSCEGPLKGQQGSSTSSPGRNIWVYQRKTLELVRRFHMEEQNRGQTSSHRADHFLYRPAGNLEEFSSGDAAWGCLSKEHMLFISLLLLVFPVFSVALHMTSEIRTSDQIPGPLAFFHWNVFSLISGSQSYRGFMLCAFLPSPPFSFCHVYHAIHLQTCTKASDWWSR